MGVTIQTWFAQARQDAGRRIVHVRGDGKATQAGYKLKLEWTNEGIIDVPDLIALVLVVTSPGVAAQVITPVSVDWEDRVAPEVTKVLIKGLETGTVEVHVEESDQ